jgi:MYXO-CTERM domain-containing protein
VAGGGAGGSGTAGSRGGTIGDAPASGGGCSCATAGAMDHGSLVALVGVGLVLARRRRRG